jgi:hypothetical protein
VVFAIKWNSRKKHECLNVVMTPNSMSKNALINRDPEKYKRILSGLKAGRGVLELSVKEGLSKTTVQTIRERNRDILPDWKRRTAQALGEAGLALAESLVSGHEKIPWAQKALSLGILLTKKAELEGTTPPQKVVHEIKFTHESLIKRFKEIKSSIQPTQRQ